MKTITSLISAGLLTAALAACAADFYEIEETEPVLSGTFPGHYQTLSACVKHAWGREYHTNEQIIDGGNQVATLQGAWKGWGFQTEGTVTTFTQIDAAKVRVEFRQRAERQAPPEWIWRAVEDCARQA